ncbi:hypothetical protein PHYBLDRAFT_158354 [Phycomyces blakesleeanus NRRL 1555(-)]|uniref:AB hydrolase-1 domain-containing protein n=1 Tax=Phycomyces blakesleeanus (strain ATCC 8743b / DSM 1359 / FGSC 10004 / NBRC 33097 / NRRL 1555) TaxID=763407 RepID=A0A167N784_PHYB8|nr:hypothetical protein PHYBLDRAFT_158354 [Phycomyces blakesleeanus NRRL 1555(-)]OAD75209.1 hypothetical protein PHYBLDRAFT_158354 [Phycomyces blakesleeanus NRRL 1555(-)]|eukprot:XP_018293249.1 hypothetical protein PHYBLDRAFT_158354 [Phycomyces blakesleeanus NRRL 1555(-)]
MTCTLSYKGRTLECTLEEKPIINDKKYLILLVHGLFGNKEALYLPDLAKELPYSSARMSLGQDNGKPAIDIIDTVSTLFFIANHYISKGYEIHGIIGHSTGGLAALKYATTCERPLAHVINISTPYSLNDINVDHTLEALYNSMAGSSESQEREKILGYITDKEKEQFKSWSNSHRKQHTHTHKYIYIYICVCVHMSISELISIKWKHQTDKIFALIFITLLLKLLECL